MENEMTVEKLWRSGGNKGPVPDHVKRIVSSNDASKNAGCERRCSRCRLEQLAGQISFDAEFGAHLGSLASETTVELFGTSGIMPSNAAEPLKALGRFRPMFEGSPTISVQPSEVDIDEVEELPQYDKGIFGTIPPMRVVDKAPSSKKSKAKTKRKR